MTWRRARRWGRNALIVAVCILAMAAKNTNCKGGGGHFSGHLGCGGLSRLWQSVGGSWTISSTMSAIGMAESGGDQYAHGYNNNGTEDQGYFQINTANAGTYYPADADIYRPKVNARAAVRIYNAMGLTAWSSYDNGSYHGYCGQ